MDKYQKATQTVLKNWQKLLFSNYQQEGYETQQLKTTAKFTSVASQTVISPWLH
jgi:hypothetical protein